MGCCSSAVQGVVPPTRGYELTEDNVCTGYDKEKGPYFVMRKEDKKEILFAKSGTGSEAETPCWSVPYMFKKAATEKKDKNALLIEWPSPPIGADKVPPPALPLEEWKQWTWGEYYDECYEFAKFLGGVGAQRFDGVMIYGFNSPWWIMAQMGAIMGGCLAAGIYPTDTMDQLKYKTQYADASVAVCGDEKHFQTFSKLIDDLPYLKAIVCWNHTNAEKVLKRADGTEVRVLSWDEAITEGKGLNNDGIDLILESLDPRECCALVFTSGTTGNPKAVMLSHDNLTFQARATIQIIPGIGESVEHPERSLSYLPLSHVAGLIVDILIPLSITCNRPSHTEVYFARAYDLKAGSLGDRLRAVRPTTFLGVPRVWQKVADKIKAKGAQTKGLKKKLATAAKKRGLEYEINRNVGGSGMKPGGYDFYNKLVLQKIKAVLGLEECKIAISGAAPLSPALQEYWGSLGISINDTYGMSECGGATCVSSNECHLWGTVGSPLPGSEVRVFTVDENDINVKSESKKSKDIFNPSEDEQGEICYRGRHIMMGYLQNPKLGEEHMAEIEKKNLEAIDNEGYLHSGDKGTCGENGFFRITGRYKELIIGEGGENIAPVPIEDHIKELAPGISSVVMIGNGRKYNTAIVTLRTVGATGELPGTNKIDPDARHYGSEGTETLQQAVKDQKWIKHVEDAIVATNKNGKVCHSNAFKIQKFTIIFTDLSIVPDVEPGELTTTMKLKRAVTDLKYKAIIDHMYETEGTYIECPQELMPKKGDNEPKQE